MLALPSNPGARHLTMGSCVAFFAQCCGQDGGRLLDGMCCPHALCRIILSVIIASAISTRCFCVEGCLGLIQDGSMGAAANQITGALQVLRHITAAWWMSVCQISNRCCWAAAQAAVIVSRQKQSARPPPLHADGGCVGVSVYSPHPSLIPHPKQPTPNPPHPWPPPQPHIVTPL